MWCCLGPAVLRAAWTAPGGDQWTVQCQGISQSLVEAKHALLFPELLPLVPNCISLKNISHSDMCLLPFIPALDSTGITLVPFCGFNFTPSHTCSFISVSFTQEFSKPTCLCGFYFLPQIGSGWWTFPRCGVLADSVLYSSADMGWFNLHGWLGGITVGSILGFPTLPFSILAQALWYLAMFFWIGLLFLLEEGTELCQLGFQIYMTGNSNKSSKG